MPTRRTTPPPLPPTGFEAEKAILDAVSLSITNVHQALQDNTDAQNKRIGRSNKAILAVGALAVVSVVLAVVSIHLFHELRTQREYNAAKSCQQWNVQQKNIRDFLAGFGVRGAEMQKKFPFRDCTKEGIAQVYKNAPTIPCDPDGKGFCK